MALDYHEIGRNVRRYRMQRNLKQAQLAEMAGISEQHISYIECASTKLGLPVLVRIAEALSVEVNMLLGYHTDQLLSDGQPTDNGAIDREMQALMQGISVK